MKKYASSLWLFAAGFLFFGFYSLLGIDLHHDGIMFKAAVDVADGAAVFRETFSQYGILPPLLQGLAVKLFGAELVVLKLLTAFFYGLTLVAYDMVWKRFFTAKEKIYRAFYILLFFVLSADCCVTSHPWASVYALFFLLLTIHFSLRFFEDDKRNIRYAAASGVLAAVVFGFRQPCGLTTLLAAGAITFIVFSVSVSDARRFAAGFFCGFGAVLIIYVLMITVYGAWHDYWIQTWQNAFVFAVKRGSGNGSWSDTVANFFPFITGDRGYIDAIFAFFPLLTLGLFARMILNGKWKESIPLIVVIIYALSAWHQYYPVPCMRHLYWASVPMMGVFVFIIKELIQKGGKKGGAAVALLMLILFFPVAFRCYFGVKRINSITKRETSSIPGIRGLRLFAHEKQVCSILYSFVRSLPPELVSRGVFNHTPDGVWSVILPVCKWKHPLFCRVAETAYPDYDREAFKYCVENRPVVISSVWQSLPGYVMMQELVYNGVKYHLFIPLR